MPNDSSPKTRAGADRVKRVIRADGTIKEYRYAAYKKPVAAPVPEAPWIAKGTLGEVMANWQRSPEWRALARSTQELYSRAMADLRDGDALPIGNITRKDLIQQRNAIAQNPKRGPGAARSFVIGCAALFKFAKEYGETIAIPHPTERLATGLQVGELAVWSEAEYALAVKHLPEHLRRIVVLARFTGQRRSDLIKMKWSDYDGSSIHVVQQKTGTELDIPVGPQLKAELAAWRGLPSQPILTRPNGLPWVGANVSKVLPRELDKIPGFPKERNLHGLRKLCATALAEAGATMHQIMAITGHKTPTMVLHYTKGVEQKKLASQVHLFLEIPAGGAP